MCTAIEKLAVPKSVPRVALAVVAEEKEEVNVVLKSTACPIESVFFCKKSPKKGAVGGRAANKNLATPVSCFMISTSFLYYCCHFILLYVTIWLISSGYSL